MIVLPPQRAKQTGKDIPAGNPPSEGSIDATVTKIQIVVQAKLVSIKQVTTTTASRILPPTRASQRHLLWACIPTKFPIGIWHRLTTSNISSKNALTLPMTTDMFA